MRYASFIVLILLCQSCATTSSHVPSRTTAAENLVHHYVYFGRDREHISDSGFLTTPRLEGAQLLYGWNELQPSKGVYDFSPIRNDLGFLKSKGKKLFVQIQATTFNPARAAIPKYLLSDPKFHGGVVYQYDEQGKPAGRVVMLWDSNVRSEFQKLLKSLAEEFDGKIEGIALQETAIDVTREGQPLPLEFTPSNYRDAVLSDMRALRKCFKHSATIQYANSMPGESLPDEDHGYLRSVFSFAEKNEVGVGAPDLMPENKYYRNNGYKLIHELPSGKIPIGIAVQDGNYIGKTDDDGPAPATWPDIVPQLADFAQNFLHVNYIFWGAQEPYFSHDVLQFLK